MLDTKLKRRTVSINFWGSSSISRANLGSNGRAYSGRLLGLITDEEFASLIENSELQKKMLHVSNHTIIRDSRQPRSFGWL